MKRARRTILTIPAIIIASATAADAHVGIGATSGFSNGLLHPISGIDHILAMIMVGIFAVQLGGRAIFMVPCAFVAAMIVGGVLGMANVSVGLTELGIAFSVFALGALIACRFNPALPLAMSVVALFGLFHGHAHGTEMPANAAGLAYGSGFLLMTSLLHAAGIICGLSIGSRKNQIGSAIIRSFGAIAALIGMGLIAGTI